MKKTKSFNNQLLMIKEKLLFLTRRKVLINKEFQFNFCMSLIIPMLIMSVMYWIAIEVYIKKLIQVGINQGLPVSHEYYKLIKNQRSDLLLILMGFTILIGIVFFVWGIFYSHRIAGPLFKMDKWLKETETIDEAVERPVQFRKKDFFQELPNSLKAFIARIKNKDKGNVEDINKENPNESNDEKVA
jgi:hypothetical protein